MLKYEIIIRHFSKLFIIKFYDYTRHLFLCLTQMCTEKIFLNQFFCTFREYHIFGIKTDLEFFLTIIRDIFSSPIKGISMNATLKKVSIFVISCKICFHLKNNIIFFLIKNIPTNYFLNLVIYV